MVHMRSFATNISGSSLEKFSVAAGLIALSAIAATHLLATWSKYGHAPILANLQASSGAGPNGPAANRAMHAGSQDVDYSSTGAIYRTVVEPCSTKPK
jgi:hypothetical protein